MGRTTKELVAEIVDLDPTKKVDPFIEAATYLVTRCCSTAVVGDTTVPYYSDEDLELIERWLAAHFYCVMDSRALQEGVSSLRIQYQSRVDIGLDVTHYGQQAKLLDTAGGLAALDAAASSGRLKLKGGVKWLGTPNEEVF